MEVLVVGDGVEEASRRALERFADDDRVHFFDRPKGPRNGESHRHEILLESTRGRIVCYLSDDDLLLRSHVAEMLRLLEAADFAHPPPVKIDTSDALVFFPWSYARPEFAAIAGDRRGSVGLTGTAHTLDAYRRLPHGWRTTPPGIPTDHYMWVQFLELPGLRVATGDRLTFLSFPDTMWRDVPEDVRATRVAGWLRRSREPGFEAELDRLLRASVVRAAEDRQLWMHHEQEAMAALRRTRTWRMREWLLRFRLARALAARRSPTLD